MIDPGNAPNVGAPDPEQRNSPIFDSGDSEELSLDLELEEGVFFFNNQAFDIGRFVRSGDERLRCEERGVWVREGSCKQE